MNIVRCPFAPKTGAQYAKGLFPCKIALRLKNVCYEISLCENRGRQNCKVIIGLSLRVEIISGGRPLVRENLPSVAFLNTLLSYFRRGDRAREAGCFVY